MYKRRQPKRLIEIIDIRKKTVRKIKASNTAIKSLKELQRRGGSIFKITNYI